MTLGFRLDTARIRIFGSPTKGGITLGKELIFLPHCYALVGVKSILDPSPQVLCELEPSPFSVGNAGGSNI